MSGITERDLDRPLWGAEAIGHEANVVDEAGEVNVKKTMRLLEQGLLPGTKVGRLWTSTPRRIRSVFAGDAA